MNKEDLIKKYEDEIFDIEDTLSRMPHGNDKLETMRRYFKGFIEDIKNLNN